jgi:hypothetical protein
MTMAAICPPDNPDELDEEEEDDDEDEETREFVVGRVDGAMEGSGELRVV